MTTAPSNLGCATKVPRPGVHSLPQTIRRSFADNFIPAVLQEMGCSSAPWQNLSIDGLQECVNRVYPELEYVVNKGDALISAVSLVSILCLARSHLMTSQSNARMMNFRNTIANTAIVNVQTFMARHKTPDLISEYVQTGLLYYGEIPFLYRVFECTDVSSKKERGGYKVVSTTFPSFLSFLAKQSDDSQMRHELFQSQPILNTILIYFGRRGIKQHFPTVSAPGQNNPVGMLALVCTAVGTFLTSNHLF